MFYITYENKAIVISDCIDNIRNINIFTFKYTNSNIRLIAI